MLESTRSVITDQSLSRRVVHSNMFDTVEKVLN